MSIKIVYSDETIKLKSIKVGTPVRRVTAGSFAIGNLGGVDVSVSESDGSILAYNKVTGNYEVTNLRSDQNISLVFDSSANSYSWGFTNNTFTGDLIPDSDEAYDLGSVSYRWKDLHLSGNTINLGSIRLKDSGGDLVVIDSDNNKISLALSLSTNNTAILSLDSSTGSFVFNDSDIARTDINEVFHQGVTVVNGATVDSATITNLANTQLIGSQATITNITNTQLTGSQATLDSADVTTLNTTTGTITNLTNTQLTGSQASFDSAYTNTFNAVTGTINNLTNTQLTGSQATLDSADITTLNTTTATITNVNVDSATVTNLATTQLTASQATFDSADFGTLRVTGNTVLDGNLTVSGTQTTVNTETINLADNTIVLNSNATGTPSENAGIEIERGDQANKSFLWHENNQYWTLSGETLETTGKILFGNVYSSEGDLPNASSYHGMFAHVHGTGKGYFAHGGAWHKLMDMSSTNDSATITNLANTQLTGSQATFDHIQLPNGNSTTGITLGETNEQIQIFKATGGNAFIAHNHGDNRSLFIQSNNIDLTTAGGGEYQARFFDQGGADFYYHNTKTLSVESGGVNVVGNLDVTGAFTTITTTGLTEGTNLYYTSARADSDAKNAVSATGDLNYDPLTGIFSFDVEQVYTKTNFDSDLGAALDGGTGITYDSSTDTISITNTNVTAGTYGSASLIPVFTVNAQGQLDSAGSVAVAGVSSFSFDSANGNISIGTADGGTFLTTITLDPYTTSNLTEGSNLYYTTTRADSDFDVRLATKTTTNVAEGTNLYYTTTRADSDFDVRLGTKSTTNVSEGSNLYYTTARADSDAKASLLVNDTGGDGSLTYDSASGVFTYTGPSASETRAHFSGGTGVTITDGSVAIGQSVGTTDDVTFGKVTQDSATSKGIQFLPQTSAFSQTAGSLYFDSDHQKGLSVRLNTPENVNPDVNLNIGQEIFIYAFNNTGAAISNGDAVYISGTYNGTDNDPLITKARANTSTTGQPTGLATMDIPNGAHGWVTRYGLVRDVNTAGMTPGNILFLSPDSAGVVTETPVTVDTGYPFHIGRVITADANTGIILVDPQSEHFDDLRVENKLKTTQLVADSASLLNIQFDTSTFDSHQPENEGLLYYDNTHKTLNYNDDITGMVHEIGLQNHQRVFNDTGSVIKKGSPLYFNGNYTSGAIDVPKVALSDASDVNKYNSQGLAAHDIANNSYGHCMIQGQITEVNTSGVSAGTQFFVSATTAGGITNTPPAYPNFPMCMGWVVVSGDSDTGILMVNRENHSVNSFRVTEGVHIGQNLQVDGNLTILGSQTTVGTSNVTQGAPFYRLNEGDAIGEAGTTFTGGGLDDAFFSGHFTGTTAQTYYVKIDGVGTGAGGVDTFAVALGNDSNFTSPLLTKQVMTGNKQLIHSTDNISVEFGATTGHDSGDRWSGTASPVNVDTGFFTNRNTGTSGVGYTHMGIFFDVTDEKWKLVDEYDSTPTGTINTADGSFSLATLVASNFEGNLTGAVTGNASTATALATGQNFSISGDVTASNVSFDGTGAVTLNAAITADTIINADIKSDAAIADTKLATISTAGKVNNSATTATAANTGSTIIARDASGNFAGGTFTGEVNRDAQTTVTAGTYGSTTAIPVLTIDANGFVDSAGSVAINTSLVADTTPQLGGNLDLNGNNITGTGNISTTGSLTITSTDDGSSAEPEIDLVRNSASPADGDYLGQIKFSGENDADQNLLYAKITGKISDATDGTEDGLIEYAVKKAGSNTIVSRLTGSALKLINGTGLEVAGNITVDGTVDGRDVATDGSKLDGIEANATADQTASEILTAIKTVDGASSGLDADLLDGQEGSHYRINVYNNSGTLLN